MQNGSSVEIPPHSTWSLFARFGANLYAQSVIINKITALKLSWIKVPLLVGYALNCLLSKSDAALKNLSFLFLFFFFFFF